MAALVPEDFDTRSLEHSEQRVLEAFRTGLGDDWFLIPSVHVHDRGSDREIDLILVSTAYGAIVVETKGGVVSRDGDEWRSYDVDIKDPFLQAKDAKYGLIREVKGSASRAPVFISHAVALPDTSVGPGGFGLDAPRNLIFDRDDLQDPAAAIRRMFRDDKPVTPERVETFIRAVRADITFIADRGRFIDAAKAAIDENTADRLGVARSMDQNQRVLVSGGAGSGKSWLVVDWARRAVERGERTAVVCFNRPMADRLAFLLDGTDATVDTYHGLALGLLEPFGFTPPEDADATWWQKAVTKELKKRAKKVGTPFDTIIVDEAQDLRPKWLDSLRGLLDPSGPARLLMVMDPAQAIYTDKWSRSDEFFRSTLDVNLRNSRSIGELCARLGGPKQLQDNPAGAKPWHLPATGQKELVKRVKTAIERLTEDGVLQHEIAVLTTRRADRDRLLADGVGKIRLTRWEDRDADSVTCETVQRTKGLEWTAVILASLDEPIDEKLLYIGASRPRTDLVLVGRASLKQVLEGGG